MSNFFSSYSNGQIIAALVILVILVVLIYTIILDSAGRLDNDQNVWRTLTGYFMSLPAAVQAYEDPDFKGISKLLAIGNNTAVGKISSLKVADGYKVTLYSNKGIAPITLTKGEYAQLGEGFNDASVLAFVEVNPIDPAAGATITKTTDPAPTA